MRAESQPAFNVMCWPVRLKHAWLLEMAAHVNKNLREATDHDEIVGTNDDVISEGRRCASSL